MGAKEHRRKQLGQKLISLIRELDKRIENHQWQETVKYLPLIYSLVDLLGLIGHFNSQKSTSHVLQELNEMSNDESLSHNCILSRFAEITGLMIIVMDAKTTNCTIYGPLKFLMNCNHPQFLSFIGCPFNKWKVLPFILLRRKYRMGAETEHYIHISLQPITNQSMNKEDVRWSNFIRQVEQFQFVKTENSHARFNIQETDGDIWNEFIGVRDFSTTY